MPIQPGKRANINVDMTPYAPASSTEYSDQYKEDLFLVWYQANRPRGQKFASIIPKDEYGRVPNLRIAQEWARQAGWNARADELDREVFKRLDEIAIENKVAMHVRHAEIGKELLEIGIEWLEKNKIVTATEAARVLDLGARLEKENTGGAQAMVEVTKLSSGKLSDVIEKMMPRLSEDELAVIEAEVFTEEE